MIPQMRLDRPPASTELVAFMSEPTSLFNAGYKHANIGRSHEPHLGGCSVALGKIRLEHTQYTAATSIPTPVIPPSVDWAMHAFLAISHDLSLSGSAPCPVRKSVNPKLVINGQ